MFVGLTLRSRTAGCESPQVTRGAVSTPRHTHRRRRVGRAAAALGLVAILAAVLGGCGSTATSGGSGGSSGSTEIKVFAAASLTESFTKIADQFSAAHPNVKVALNFASSSDLAVQIQQGAPADVFASADTTNMDKVKDLVDQPQTFAGNKLAIAVEPGNPKGVKSLADLTSKNLKVVLAAPEVPAGRYAREALAAQGLTVHPVSLEDTVKGVAAKVSLGEADAGVVYVTDVTAAKGAIDGVSIPDDQNEIATYPIAVVKQSSHAADAQAFVAYVLSSEGRQVLSDFGFLPPVSAQ
jgi:molybdate transport system substrate-binding protein